MAHAYAQLSDIQGEFKSVTFDTTSTPTATQVDDFIDEEESTVESSVGMKYTIPVSSTASPKAFKLVRKLVKRLVAGRIKNIIAVKSGSQDANQGKISDGDALIADAQKTLLAIRNGDIKLVDGVLASTNDGVRSFNVDNEDSSDADDIDDVNDPLGQTSGSPSNSIPAFQRGKKMW